MAVLLVFRAAEEEAVLKVFAPPPVLIGAPLLALGATLPGVTPLPWLLFRMNATGRLQLPSSSMAALSSPPPPNPNPFPVPLSPFLSPLPLLLGTQKFDNLLVELGMPHQPVTLIEA